MNNYRMTGSSELTPLEREIIFALRRLTMDEQKDAFKRLREMPQETEVF